LRRNRLALLLPRLVVPPSTSRVPPWMSISPNAASTVSPIRDSWLAPTLVSLYALPPVSNLPVVLTISRRLFGAVALGGAPTVVLPNKVRLPMLADAVLLLYTAPLVELSMLMRPTPMAVTGSDDAWPFTSSAAPL